MNPRVSYPDFLNDPDAFVPPELVTIMAEHNAAIAMDGIDVDVADDDDDLSSTISQATDDNIDDYLDLDENAEVVARTNQRYVDGYLNEDNDYYMLRQENPEVFDPDVLARDLQNGTVDLTSMFDSDDLEDDTGYHEMFKAVDDYRSSGFDLYRRKRRALRKQRLVTVASGSVDHGNTPYALYHQYPKYLKNYPKKLPVNYSRHQKNNMYYIWWMVKHCDRFNFVCRAFESETRYMANVANWISRAMRHTVAVCYKLKTVPKFSKWWIHEQRRSDDKYGRYHAQDERNDVDDDMSSCSSLSNSEFDAATDFDYDDIGGYGAFQFWPNFRLYARYIDPKCLEDLHKPYLLASKIGKGRPTTRNSTKTKPLSIPKKFNCTCADDSFRVSIVWYKHKFMSSIARHYDMEMKRNITKKMRSRCVRFLELFYPIYSRDGGEADKRDQDYDRTLQTMLNQNGGGVVDAQYMNHVRFLHETFDEALPPECKADKTTNNRSKMFKYLFHSYLEYVPMLMLMKKLLKDHDMPTFKIFPIYPSLDKIYKASLPIAADIIDDMTMEKLYTSHVANMHE